MSLTPRTDEAEANAMASGIPISMVCRQIERELNEARECLREAMEFIYDNKSRDWSEVMIRWRKAAGLDKQ